MARDERDNNRGLGGRVLGAVGSVVSPVVGSVVSPVVDAVDVDGVVARIDLDEVIARTDLNAAADQIDLDRLLARLDVDGLLTRIDLDALLARLDLDAVIARADLNAALDTVDADRLLDRVDLNRVLDRVDVNRVLDRIEPDRLLDRVDPDRLLDRVDADRLLARVDADALLERIDVNRVIERTELRSIIARSTTGAFTEVLDAVRVRLVAVDQVAQGSVARLLRRPGEGRPGRPGSDEPGVTVRGLSRAERGVAVQGRYAGSLSRFVAFLLDQFLVGVLFALGLWLAGLATEVVLGRTLSTTDHRLLTTVVFLTWEFLYLAGQLAASGRTIGMAVLGLQVVEADGGHLHARAAVVRTLAFPLSFLLFGAGFLLGLVRADRRELHDLLGGTAVVYAWDAQVAALRADAVALAPGSSEPGDAPAVPGVVRSSRLP